MAALREETGEFVQVAYQVAQITEVPDMTLEWSP